MKITVFGASGRTGLQLIQQALDLGHDVNAYVRRENSIVILHPKLKIIVGNLNDSEKITEAVKGSDACFSALGGGSLKKPSTEFTEGIKLITKIMEEEKVNRLIYLSSIGASESYYYMQRFVRFLVIDLLLRIPMADHTMNETSIRSSTLNYTIVRPGTLSDGPLSKKLVSGSEKRIFKGNPKISRASVASFMLMQLADKTFERKAAWLYEEK